MSEAETARLVAEIIGVLLAASAGFLWIAKLIWRALAKLDGVNDELVTVNKHLRQLNGTVVKHDSDLIAQKELNAWFSGVLGEPKPGERGHHPP